MTAQRKARIDRVTTLQGLRVQAEHWVDLLIAFLDATDDYLLNELEHDDTEPIRAIGQVIGCLEDDEPSLERDGSSSNRHPTLALL